MELQIGINKEEVINQASELCSLIAYRNDDYTNGAPSTNTKSLIFTQYFSEGVSNLLAQGSRLDPIMYDDAIAFIVSDRYNEDNYKVLEQAASNYLINIIVSKWLAVISKEDAEQYETTADVYLAQVKNLLNARRSPSRKQLKGNR